MRTFGAGRAILRAKGAASAIPCPYVVTLALAPTTCLSLSRKKPRFSPSQTNRACAIPTSTTSLGTDTAQDSPIVLFPLKTSPGKNPKQKIGKLINMIKNCRKWKRRIILAISAQQTSSVFRKNNNQYGASSLQAGRVTGL